MKKYKYTFIFLVAFVICLLITLSRIEIESGHLVFLPGYKAGQNLDMTKNEHVKSLVKVSRTFADGTQVIVVVRAKSSFFESEALTKLAELQRNLSDLRSVKSVVSVLNYPFKKAYFNGNNLSREILEDPEARNFISFDGKYILLNCVLEPRNDLKFDPQVIKEIRRVLLSYSEFSPLLFGESVINYYLFQEILKQSLLYPAIMFAIILFVFFIQTRCLKATLLALFYPVMSIVLVFAVALSFGMVLNVMTVMSISFLIVIGSAYGLHFYNGVLRFGKDVRKKMFRPIFYSMATTAAGFLSFLFVNIQAFREMGLLVSTGLILNFILLFTSGYELLEENNGKSVKTSLILKLNSRKIGTALLIAITILILFTPLILKNLTIGMDQASYFSERSDVGQAVKILKDNFSYREPIYVVLRKSSVFTLTDGEIIHEIIEKLRNINGISSVQFPISYPIPTLLLARRFQPAISFFVADSQTIRLMVNMTSESYTRSLEIKQEIERILESYKDYSYTLASVAFVVQEMNSQIVKNQLQTLFISLLFIFIAVLIAFRDIFLSMTIILPVALTALMNFVFMSVLKIRLEMSSSIVASILTGLVVDYSIHLAHDLRMTRDINITIQNIVMPILTNALGLIAGFLVLVFSQLLLFRNVSVLLCVGIAFGCIFTLFAEPLILQKLCPATNRDQNKLQRLLRNRREKLPRGREVS